MKKLTLALMATTALAFGAGSASAQGWMPINERQERLDDRIDAGVRTGDLTRAEAVRLRTDFRDIARLETRYRANGLSSWERSDLDRRFDGLSARIRYQRNDSQEREWMSINRRQAQLDRRIDQGVKAGQLTRREAVNARASFQTIARLENRYRRNGLNAWERADLDRRFDALAAQIHWDRRDGDRRYGYNAYPRR